MKIGTKMKPLIWKFIQIIGGFLESDKKCGVITLIMQLRIWNLCSCSCICILGSFPFGIVCLGP